MNGSPTHFWVAPPFDGLPTGGTIYNAALCEALSRAGILCRRVGVDEASRALSTGGSDCYWVDTLYLDHVPELARANVANASLRLVVHYLPSLVEPDADSARALRLRERAVLDWTHGCLATSHFMAGVVRKLGVPSEHIAVVEPGVAVARAALRRDARAPELRVVLVANVVRAKGILPLLQSLERSMLPDVSLRLTVVGSLEPDEEYANECRALVESCATLAKCVDFLGPSAHADVLADMEGSDVLVSASRMESYGMALAEARTVGMPIVALRGGNVENLVEEAAGGALFDDIDSLVADLLRLATDSEELRRRAALARGARRIRTWDEAAQDFVRAPWP